ncbi:hypothetical protein [Natronosalvus halobius]|uniref:hypothetical protein n=1 Tax=Natronosalvus halobius TaxID=2953746 RepID=UPI00209D5CE6|nr:hypothetical protein [Natronosalvus halobius]USZ72598.1 hypothetical protein NGM15_04590 [Natronosalvus halobius]
MDNSNGSLSRRRLLGGIGAAGLTGLAGCLGSFLGSSGRNIRPTEPSDPPQGTPEEFYYVLENGIQDYDITVEALYENDGDLILEYQSTVGDDLEHGSDSSADLPSDESDGDSTDESDDAPATGVDHDLYQATLDEMGVIVQAYNQTVVVNGDSDYGMLVGDLVNPLTGQAYGWGVKNEWLEAHNEGEMQQMTLWMNIQQMIVYEEDVAEASNASED